MIDRRMTRGELATRYNLLATPNGVQSCNVAEFDPTTYKGLRSGIGKQRKSSKHFGCKDKCCAMGNFQKPSRKR